MIVIASRQEKELLDHLRSLGTSPESAAVLSAEVIKLKRQITDLEIQKSKIEEDHARDERELLHKIGLEKKRQEVELEQAKKEASLAAREKNLKAERERFEATLKFNTERFQSMEKYLKDMFADVMARLPNVNVELTRKLGR